MIYKVIVDIGIDYWLIVYGMDICYERIIYVIVKVIDDIYVFIK